VKVKEKHQVMWPRYPRCKIRARTPLFQAPKSVCPVRSGIWVTEESVSGKEAAGFVMVGREKISTYGKRTGFKYGAGVVGGKNCHCCAG
jgi:hypothetical protein